MLSIALTSQELIIYDNIESDI